MYLYELSAILIYFSILLTIGILSYKRHLSASDFIIGSRSMNYWLTALAAHASDMSSWLFMGYPAAIFLGGIFKAWAAVGLVLFMLLNWILVAPKIRIATEQYNSLTFSSFFESRLADTSGMIRVFTAIMSLVFYTIYISAGLVGLGLLLETLFGINYQIGVLLGILIVIPYVFIGGYTTLAWIDLFQGLFLMCVIIAVPYYILPKVGGWDNVKATMLAKNLSTSLVPNFSSKTVFIIVLEILGWGLGYFGQPHIVTKFMGIKNVHEISKSRTIGMTWMMISLLAATCIGLIGIAYFPSGIADAEQVFIEMVKETFHPFLIGFILCAVIAATINAMSSQVLVLSSSLTEDFYKRLFRKTASTKELLIVSRIGVIVVAFVAFGIAFMNLTSIYSLVLYAWSGLGAAFGPLLLLSLYSKSINKYGAWAGILLGGSISAVWPYINKMLNVDIPSVVPAFFISLISISFISKISSIVLKKRLENSGQ
ncbi:MAG: sodium/proline symporter [Chlamydiae bacterium]|nr:sodium/proline symporter [Chlamydiota bacterium]